MTREKVKRDKVKQIGNKYRFISREGLVFAHFK